MTTLRIKVKYKKKELVFTHVKSYYKTKQFLEIMFDLHESETGLSRLEIKLTEIQSIKELQS